MTSELGPLWARILAGDGHAWQELVNRYAALVYSVARRAGLGTADAEDCGQHTWLALYRRRGQIKDPEAIPAWLMRTTQRQARRLAARLGRELPLADVPALIAPDSGDAGLRRSEFRGAVAEALSRLDPRCRRLLLSLFIKEPPLTYEELARRLNIQPNSVGPLRSRCLARLKTELRKLGWDLH